MPTYEKQLKQLIKLHEHIEATLAAQEKEPVVFFVPNPFQDIFIKSQKRNRWMFCGNQSGKTQANASEGVRFALGKHPYRKIEVPNEGCLVSPDANLSREIMEPAVRRWLGETHIKRWRERERIMDLDNGSTIYFKTAESGVTKFTGRKYQWVGIDEDCPEEIYRELLMRTFTLKGDIWGSITPLYSSWMYNSIYRNQYKDPEIEIFFGSTEDNKSNLPNYEQEVNRIKTSYSVDELDARLHGRFLKFAGLIYKEFDDRIHLVHPFKIPDHWPRYRFIDHGLHDPMVCLWMALSPDEEFHFYREYYQRDRTIQQNCQVVKDLSGGEKYIFTAIDHATNKRSAQDVNTKTDFRAYADCGIKPLRLWPKVEITTKINKVITRLNNRKLFIHRCCINTLDEIKTWGREKNGEPERGNDHALDCIAGACLIDPKFYQSKVDASRAEIETYAISEQSANFQ